MIDLYRQLEQEHGLPEGLLSAVATAESSNNPAVINRRTATGKPSLGLMQFQPDTAEAYGIDPMVPEQAATGAAKMYSDLLKQFDGDLDSALAAYNWGSGNVSKLGLAKAPKETRDYISKIKKMLPKQYAANTVVASDTDFDSSGYTEEQLAIIEEAKKKAQASASPEEPSYTDDQLAVIEEAKKKAQGQPDSPPGMGETARDQFLQGTMFGLGDEAQASLAALIYSQMNGVPYDEAYNQALEVARTKLQQGADKNPVTANVSSLAGAIGTGGLLAKGATKLAPGIAAKLGAAAKSRPYLTSAGVGGVSGGVYGFGTGEGSAAERAENAAAIGLGGAAVGPAVTFAGRKAIAPAYEKYLAPYVANLLGKMKQPGAAGSQADELLKMSETAGSNNVAPAVAKQTEDLSELAKKDSVLRLTEGARTQSLDLMRDEAEARAGVLGAELEKRVRTADDLVKYDAENVTKALIGKDDVSSEEALLSGVERFMQKFQGDKKVQQEIMSDRNRLIAQAKIDPEVASQTLLSSIKNLTKDPELAITYNLPTTGAPLRERVNMLNKLLSVQKRPAAATAKSPYGYPKAPSSAEAAPAKPLDFLSLQAWRQDLGAWARKNVGTQEAVAANKLANKYDDWLENQLTAAIKEGDPQLAEKIFAANKGYAEFKKLYGTNKYSGESPIIEKILKQEDLTPRQLVNTIFGKTQDSKDVSGQLVGRMIKALPEDQQRAFKEDLRAGLMSRALENSRDAGTDQVILTKLRRELSKLSRNDVYKEHLAEPNSDKVLKTLLSDLSKYSNAISNKDAVNLSGTAPFLIRWMQKFSNVPFMNDAIGMTAKAVEHTKQTPKRLRVEQALSEFKSELDKNVAARSKNWSTLAPFATMGATTSNDKQDRKFRTKITIRPQQELPYVDLPEVGGTDAN